LPFSTATRRRWTFAASFVLAVGLFAGFVPWTISNPGWRAASLKRLSNALGAEGLSAGTIRFALLPTPYVEVENLAMRHHGGTTLQAPLVEARLRLGPLFKGALKPAAVAFAKPEINLVLPESDTRGVRRIAQAASSGGLLFLPGSLTGLDKITLDGGRLAIRTGVAGESDRYDNVRLRLAFSGTTRPLSFVFSGTRNGEETRASFRGASRAAIDTGAIEPIAFSYWSPGLTFEFDGKGSLTGATALSGQLIARTGMRAPAPFLQDLAGFGITTLPPMDLAATLDFNDRGANLTDIRLNLDKDRVTGVGALRHDGQRWHISGTLASEKVDLAPFAASLNRLRTADGGWNTANIDTDAMFAANIDLRLSADRLTLGDHELTRAALALLTRVGRAELILADALFHEGHARFRLTAVPGGDGLDVKLTSSLDRANMGAVLSEYTSRQRFKGKGNAALALETSGRSMAQFIANSEGRASMALRDGEITGIDLNRLAQRRGSRPDILLNEALSGRTTFESATVQARISRGLATPVEGRMQGGRIVGSVSGQVDFALGITDLSGSVVQVPAEAFAVEPIPLLDFSVTGPLAEPRIAPSIAALLRRS